MHAYKTMLENCGITDTRSAQIAEALSLLHASIENLDDSDRVLFASISPEAISAAEDYASLEDLNDDLLGFVDPCIIVFTPDLAVEPQPESNVVDLEDYR